MTSIGKIRERAAKLLTDRCDIQRRVPLSDQYGAQSDQYETVYSAVACRVMRAGNSNTSMTQDVGGVDSTRQRTKVAFAHGQTIPEDARLLIGDNTYAVQRIDGPFTNIAYKTVIVEGIV